MLASSRCLLTQHTIRDEHRSPSIITVPHNEHSKTQGSYNRYPSKTDGGSHTRASAAKTTRRTRREIHPVKNEGSSFVHVQVSRRTRTKVRKEKGGGLTVQCRARRPARVAAALPRRCSGAPATASIRRKTFPNCARRLLLRVGNDVLSFAHH